MIVRPMRPGEEAAVCQVVFAAFDRYVAPGYSTAGVEEFRRYANVSALAERETTGHFVLVAEEDGTVAGMIEVRNRDHVSMLFVEPGYQRRGIARSLLDEALTVCRQARPALAGVSVNSSPYAVPVYARLGFRPLGPEQTVHGIRFVPMLLVLQPS